MSTLELLPVLAFFLVPLAVFVGLYLWSEKRRRLMKRDWGGAAYLTHADPFGILQESLPDPWTVDRNLEGVQLTASLQHQESMIQEQFGTSVALPVLRIEADLGIDAPPFGIERICAEEGPLSDLTTQVPGLDIPVPSVVCAEDRDAARSLLAQPETAQALQELAARLNTFQQGLVRFNGRRLLMTHLRPTPSAAQAMPILEGIALLGIAMRNTVPPEMIRTPDPTGPAAAQARPPRPGEAMDPLAAVAAVRAQAASRPGEAMDPLAAVAAIRTQTDAPPPDPWSSDRPA